MKNNITIFSLGIAVVAIGMASLWNPVQAEEDSAKGKGKGKGLSRLDKNGDKAISEQEAGPKIWERLGKLDKNGDGKVAGDEFVRPGGGPSPGDGKGKGKGGEFIKRLDKNGDGNLAKDEAPEQLWSRMSRLDTNNDEVISAEEFAAARTRMSQPGQMFERLDSNKDGKITQDEVPAPAWERIGKADRDEDGAVSKQEMAAAAAAFAKSKGMDKGKGKGRPSGGSAPIFGKYDSDNDGKLSREEVPEEMWSRLSKADEDADGLVSKEELQSIYKQRQDAN